MARHELEQKLMRRLVDGLAGWATYHQACRAGRHYDEHLFYQHIEMIALGRNWQVKQQQPIIGSSSTKGARSTVDFVFFRRPGNQWSRRGLLFVEVKYLRGDHPTQDIVNIRKDIDKLRGLQPTSLANAPHLGQCGSPARFLLIVAQKSGLAATINLTSRDHADVVKQTERHCWRLVERHPYPRSRSAICHDLWRSRLAQRTMPRSLPKTAASARFEHAGEDWPRFGPHPEK